MKYLLDTDVCIHLIRHRPAVLLDRLKACAPGDVGVTTITIAELQYGAQRSRAPERNLQALEQFLLPLGIADFDYGAALAYGALRAGLEATGMSIGPLDMLIAAVALGNKMIVVTNNVREFGRVPGLLIENWLNSPAAAPGR